MSHPDTPLTFLDADAPVSHSEIDAISGLTGHFQKDPDYRTSYATDEEMAGLAEVSTVCLNFAGKLADTGFGSLNRVTAFSGKSKTVLFALESTAATPPGVRVFGTRMGATVDIDATVKKINTLI